MVSSSHLRYILLVVALLCASLATAGALQGATKPYRASSLLWRRNADLSTSSTLQQEVDVTSKESLNRAQSHSQEGNKDLLLSTSLPRLDRLTEIRTSKSSARVPSASISDERIKESDVSTGQVRRQTSKTFNGLDASATPSTCPQSSPGPTFNCTDGKWVSEESVAQDAITVPSSATIFVVGNLTTSSIVINSVSSLINVTGCVATLDGSTPTITLKLSQSDLDAIVKNKGTRTSLLILQSPSCASISTSTLTVDSSSIKSCKKVKTGKVEGTSSSLYVTLSINNSKCNVWWIVLVSVLSALIVIPVLIVFCCFCVVDTLIKWY